MRSVKDASHEPRLGTLRYGTHRDRPAVAGRDDLGGYVTRGYTAIGLYHPKSNLNVGSVLRAVGCFEAQLVIVQGDRYRRAPTDTTQQYRHVPLLHAPLEDSIPFDCIPVAVELIAGARCLHSYTHPERAFYVFGPEDSTLGKDITSWCRDVIYIPTAGCMNLAATVNVVLYDRQKKRAREERILEGTKHNGWRAA
jgi:tRNA(Leu) C34 or U34 (ribose-2'-O)-methylase TrmL